MSYNRFPEVSSLGVTPSQSPGSGLPPCNGLGNCPCSRWLRPPARSTARTLGNQGCRLGGSGRRDRLELQPQRPGLRGGGRCRSGEEGRSWAESPSRPGVTFPRPSSATESHLTVCVRVWVRALGSDSKAGHHHPPPPSPRRGGFAPSKEMRGLGVVVRSPPLPWPCSAPRLP